MTPVALMALLAVVTRVPLAGVTLVSILAVARSANASCSFSPFEAPPTALPGTAAFAFPGSVLALLRLILPDWLS